MAFVGGDSDHEMVFDSKIKDLFTVLGWRCSNRTLGFCNNAIISEEPKQRERGS
jgi:hypothetical protein